MGEREENESVGSGHTKFERLLVRPHGNVKWGDLLGGSAAWEGPEE